MQLTPVMQKYILHWGEMGARWGVNRTVAQIHALLYLSPKPLPADEIVETLSVARSNVSTSLRELQAWGLVTLTHALGDRRDHFEAKKDLWEMVNTIVDERKRREIDPTLAMLEECLADARNDDSTDGDTLRRIREMRDFLRSMVGWYEGVSALPQATIQSVMKMGGKIGHAIGGKKDKADKNDGASKKSGSKKDKKKKGKG